MKKIKIKKDDKYRVLLTELLPYEVPMLFSNEGFYNIVSKGNFEYFRKKIRNIKQTKEYGIPFNYDVKKATLGESRTLSIIHPINQLPFIDLFEKYDALMIYLSSKSPFSLRKISRVAKFCFSPELVFDEENLKSNEVEVEPEKLDRETQYIKSYFTYKPIDLIYKFYDRYEYQRLEQRFNLLLEFDISKCFYNIYSHSITWAVKDKDSAKKNARKVSFENDFDTIMQQANYNETNGIVVGPEVSRLFAEIILQEIDIRIIEILKSPENDIHLGDDYEIRRYVDDYFVFSNDIKILEKILSVCKKELEFYKLYINESKTNIRSTPFITKIAIGKREIEELLRKYFNRILLVKEDTKSDETTEKLTRKYELCNISRPYGLAREFIKDFQCIVGRNDLKYDILSKEIVRYSKRVIVKIFNNKDLAETDIKIIENAILFILDIIFYAYSLNINSSTTFKVAQTIILLCKYLDSKPQDFKHRISLKIFKEIDFIISNFQKKIKKSETNIETLNLLIALTKIDANYHFSEEKLRKIFSIDSQANIEDMNYFQIITLIYYINDIVKYSELKNEIIKSVEKKFNKGNDVFSQAEFTMLFFDYISCPYIPNSSKIKVIRYSKFATDTAKIQKEIDEICKYDFWFMDWNKEIDLERILKKKDWGYTS